MDRRTFYRFPAGLAEVWVLDQRRFKSDPDAARQPGRRRCSAARQRALAAAHARRLARAVQGRSARRAPFRPVANARDGNWAAGYGSERELLLDHIAQPRRAAGPSSSPATRT